MDRSCEQYQALIPLFLAGQLDAERRMGLTIHAGSCPPCRADMAGLQSTFAHLEERLTHADPAFGVLSHRTPAEAVAPERRGELIPFPVMPRRSAPPRRFGYWALRAAAMGIAVITAFFSLKSFQQDRPYEEHRFHVASNIPLEPDFLVASNFPTVPVEQQPIPRIFGQALDYEIPSGFGLWKLTADDLDYSAQENEAINLANAVFYEISPRYGLEHQPR